MSLIFEQGFNIKRGKEEAFQQWVADADELTKKAAPAGIEYLGTYIVSLSSEKHSGEYRTLWRLDSYAAFDAFEEEARDPDSDWGRLSRESSEFIDLPIGYEGSFSVYRPLVGPSCGTSPSRGAPPQALPATLSVGPVGSSTTTRLRPVRLAW